MMLLKEYFSVMVPGAVAKIYQGITIISLPSSVAGLRNEFPIPTIDLPAFGVMLEEILELKNPSNNKRLKKSTNTHIVPTPPIKYFCSDCHGEGCSACDMEGAYTHSSHA